MYVDAGFARDQRDSKSTSGAFIFLVGHNSFVPIKWLCKKQGAVSETEVIALGAALRLEGITALNLWGQAIEFVEGSATEHRSQKPAKGNATKTKRLVETLCSTLLTSIMFVLSYHDEEKQS